MRRLASRWGLTILALARWKVVTGPGPLPLALAFPGPGRALLEAAGGPGGGAGAGATPTASRLMGALRLESTPGVRLSFGIGDSTFGLKAWTCAGVVSDF